VNVSFSEAAANTVIVPVWAAGELLAVVAGADELAVPVAGLDELLEQPATAMVAAATTAKPRRRMLTPWFMLEDCHR